ncbi:organic cation transporter protein-like isoform X1 [Tribolium madens]|uniref:organic cation transporter protein-like isoform X1 n=1 Tax=Tribolium madens TaxID=41895 RepID=UPI001CF734D8|nr:organic cation transporter protein-like isoform X1 [Tribolium madens]XP_044256799.1 organic cation transporter protein-like isoform X1 [Tribolium madens]
MAEDDLINIDSMLAHAGDFGRYQCILMFLFSVINLLSAFHYFGQTFISIVPDHKCKMSVKEDPRFIATEQCSYTIFHKDIYQKIPCTQDWDYNNSYGYVSIVQELDWVCEDSWRPAIGQSVFFIGSVVGSLFFGILADSIGRLHVLVASNLFAFFGNITTLITTNTTIFAMCRFLAGCATDANFVMMYIIVMEYIRPSMRTFGLNLCIGVFYCFACMIIPWVAVWLQNWESLLLAIAIPHLSVLSFYFIVPESAQWLISKGRTEEAIDCFKWIARVNGKKLNDKHFEGLNRYCCQHINARKKHESFLGLLKTPKLRRKTLILIFKSMVMTLCYDAISRNVNGLGYSPFLVFTITSATILPACLFILAIQDRVGRKALASGSLLMSGIFTACSGIVQVFIETPHPTLIVILAIIARLAVTVAYNSGAQYAVELIPTVVRGQGVSVIHVTGYAASFFSPQILYLAHFWKPSPEVILGVLLVLGAVACLFLPETLNRTLPVTLQDGEEFGEDENIFDFACCRAPSESTTELTRDQINTNYM